MLQFSPLNDEQFFNPMYRKRQILDKERAEFEKLVKIYQANLRKNAHQNEDALVANVLNPLLQSLHFDTIIKDKQKGKSEVDLTIQNNDSVQLIIEAKKQGNEEMIALYDWLKIL